MIWAEIGEKNWPGPDQNFVFCFRPGRAEILISLSGQGGLGPKFQILFRAGPGLGQDCSQAGPGLKNPTRADLYFPILVNKLKSFKKINYFPKIMPLNMVSSKSFVC